MTRLQTWGTGILALTACITIVSTLICGTDGGRRTNRVYAFRIAHTDAWPRNRAILGGDPDETVSWSYYYYLIETRDGRKILVDTGFEDRRQIEKWNIEGFMVPEQLLETFHGIKPTDITDVIISHVHWDHSGNMRPWSRATIWVEESEFNLIRRTVSSRKKRYRNRMNWLDKNQLDFAKRRGRLKFLKDDEEIAPGVRVRKSASHSVGSVWVEIDTGQEWVVLAGDHLPLYENQETVTAPGDSRRPESALREIKKVFLPAPADPSRIIVPGHDPQVAVRFPKVMNRIVELRGE